MKEIKSFNHFLTPTAIQNLKINGLFEEVERASKLYASQFIDKAAEVAEEMIDYDEKGEAVYRDMVSKETILSLKDELK